jgi:hypothetical protein
MTSAASHLVVRMAMSSISDSSLATIIRSADLPSDLVLGLSYSHTKIIITVKRCNTGIELKYDDQSINSVQSVSRRPGISCIQYSYGCPCSAV